MQTTSPDALSRWNWTHYLSLRVPELSPLFQQPNNWPAPSSQTLAKKGKLRPVCLGRNLLATQASRVWRTLTAPDPKIPCQWQVLLLIFASQQQTKFLCIFTNSHKFLSSWTKALCFYLVSIPLCLAFGWQKKETYLYQQHTLCFPETVHKSWGRAIKMVCKYLGWVFKVHAGFLAAWFPSILTASLLLHRRGTPRQMCPQSLPARTSPHATIFQSRMLLCSATVQMPPLRLRRNNLVIIRRSWSFELHVAFSYQPSSCWVVLCFNNSPADFCKTITPHEWEQQLHKFSHKHHQARNSWHPGTMRRIHHYFLEHFVKIVIEWELRPKKRKKSFCF